MKNLLTNLSALLRRYRAASTLNIVGLAVAFAAFAVIMMQVRYDLGYERFHKNSKWIFRLETDFGDFGFVSGGSRPLRDALVGTMPQIEQGGILVTAYGDMPVISADSENYLEHKLIYHSPEILRMFDFRIVAGDTMRLHEPATIMLPRSVVEKLFPKGEDAIGRQLTLRTEDWSASRIPTVQVAAVYDDFPDNSAFSGAMFMEVPVDYNGNYSYSGWASMMYDIFLQIDPRDRETTEEAITSYIASSPDIPDPLKSRIGEMRLTPLGDIHLQNDTMDRFMTEKANRSTIYTLLSIAILVIVIAAINFINFATAMVPMRLKGVNMRRVLGSSVGAIRRSMIGEAMGLALIALALALFGVYGLSTSSLAGFMDIDLALGKHIPVLVLTAAVALVTGALAGIYPAFYIASFQPAMVLKGSFALSPRGKKLRTALISVQYVISLALIIVALFMQAQNSYMKNYPLGFEQENLLTVRISDDIAERREALTDQLVKNPAITEVGYAADLLVGEGFRGNSKKDPLSGEELFFDIISVSHNFTRMMGFGITGGRDFIPSDGGGYHALIFNETGRRRLSLELGEEIAGGGGVEDSRVVGFMNDFHFKPLHYGVESMALGVLSANADGRNLKQVYIRVAAGADTAGTMDYISKTIKTMDPALIDVSVEFLDETIGNLYAKETRLANLITTFSMLAVFISIIGVFGLVLFETQYRRREIGIRKVHGASIGDILRLLNTGFMRIVVACFVVAAPVAYYFVVQWQTGFAFRPPVQWWIFVAALVSVLAITTLTVTLQSYRAATENPVNSIKTE